MRNVFGGISDGTEKPDFFNGGQKLNSVLTILGAITMVITGFIMWFKELFPVEVVRWAYPVHDAGMAVMVAVIIGHIYLSVGHPASRPSFMGMTKGVVPESYAKAHHGRWYDELKENRSRLRKGKEKGIHEHEILSCSPGRDHRSYL